MGMKRLGGLLLACAVFVGGAGVTAVNAAEESCWDRAAVEIIVARATGFVDFTVSAEGTATASNSFSMEAGETVTINCSYSPASASIDFGLIAPDGTFYYKTITGGSINETVEVPERGRYTFGVRNHSSVDVRVVGFVNY